MASVDPLPVPLAAPAHAKHLRVSLDFAPLLPVIGPVFLLAVFLAVAAPSLVCQDTWLNLVAGREILQHGLPSVDHLTLLGSGRQWVDQQWLAQVVLYGASAAGGVWIADMLCIIACLVAFGLAALSAHRRHASPLAILLLLLLTVAASPWALQARAQSLALPLFSLTVCLLTRDPWARRRSTLWVLLVLCVWANVHGSVVLGALIVFLYGIQALIFRARGPVAFAYLAAPATVFISPYADKLPGYYRLMLIHPPFAGQIVEWQRTTPSPVTAVFFTLAVIAIVVVVLNRRRLAVVDLIILAVGLVTALEAVRGIIWFSLGALAVLPALMARGRSARFKGRAVSAVASILLVAAACGIVWGASRPAGSYGGRFPAAALTAVRQEPGRDVYADETSADWLLWEIPALRGRVSYDARFELFSRGEIARMAAYVHFQPGWRSHIAGYDLVVANAQHASRLVQGGGWRRIYTNGALAVIERASG
jgi:hypothetical protein